MKILSSILVMLLVLMSMPVGVYAETRSGEESVVVGADEIIDDDLYIAGGNVVVLGRVNGDVYAAGGNVQISGLILGDVLAGGGSVDVSGTVGQDVRVAGGNVQITGAQVGDSVTVLGGNVSIDSTSSIGGGVVVGAGSVRIDAPVGRGIVGGAGSLVLGNTVNGDVMVGVGSLQLMNDAAIGGNLTYTSDEELMTVGGAEVVGETRRVIPDTPARDEVSDEGVFGMFSVGYWLWSVVAMWVVGMILVKLVPKSLDTMVGYMRKEPWKAMGWGALVSLAGIPLAVLLMVTVIGIPLGLMVLVGYFVLLYVTNVWASLYVGEWLVRYWETLKGNLYLRFSVGLVVFYVVSAVPVVGWLVGLGIGLMAWGGLAGWVRGRAGRGR